MTSFVEQVVDAYCELANYPKDKVRKVNTPCLPESLITDEDLAQTSELSGVAARMLMKALWLGRPSRPDLCFIIGRLAARVSSWSHWDDHQVLRMISLLANGLAKFIALAEWLRTLEQFGLQASGDGPHPCDPTSCDLCI